jgi:lipopolysaccharide/colanic/teichoic acid biosynthesis glycosyltransferase
MKIRLSDAQCRYLPFKRFLDIVLSLIGLVALIPLFLVVALLIKLDSPGTVLFKQERAGKNGIPFEIYKFRSMCQNAEELLYQMDAYKNYPAIDIKQRLINDHRITRVGHVIRKTTIDEFPQFVNVLRGHMSIVGPRPLTMYEHNALNEYQQQRVIVKPGLTCYWQVSGRSNLDEEKRIELDLLYIRKLGFFVDMFLMLKTIPVLIFRIGAR